jgi:hypothetical protein
MRFDRTDEEWALLEPLLPTQRKSAGFWAANAIPLLYQPSETMTHAGDSQIG